MMQRDDNQALEAFRTAAEKETGPERRRFYLQLESQALSDALRRGGPEWPYAELYTCTADDLAAMNVLGILSGAHNRLDRIPITEHSRQRVHLVIFGAGAAAQSLAVHAALVAHYPNYIHDHSLRTRITMVSDRISDFLSFRERYRTLLEHCHRREVYAAGMMPECHSEKPMYTDFREDFTDIEWEFVEADATSRVLNFKLEKWAEDSDGQLLTLAFCYEDESRNLDAALSISDGLEDTPFWIRSTRGTTAIDFLRAGNARKLVSFEAPTQLPDFAVLGMYVHFAYSTVRKKDNTLIPANECPPADALASYWKDLDVAKRWSNIYNAFTLSTKLRSVGIPEERWDTLFTLDAHCVSVLAEVEHNRWCIEELILGFTPLTEAERKDLRKDPSLRNDLKERRHHPDLAAYSELGRDGARAVTDYDFAVTRALPLLAYSYKTMYQKEETSHV